MSLTVAGLAARPELGLTVLAAREVAETAPVEWAHGIDRADTDRWIAPGTLVLTLGHHMPEGPGEPAGHLTRLREAGACALAIDTGGRYPRVPVDILAVGEDIGLPILAVDPDIPFTTVVRTVAESVTASRVRALEELLGLQTSLARMLLRGGPAEVVAELDRRLDATCAVVNNSGTVIAAAADPGTVAAILPDPPFGPFLGRSRIHSAGARMVQPLIGAEVGQGAVVIDSARRFTEADRVLAGHATALLSLAVSRSLRIHEAEGRLRGEALRAILAGDPPPPEQLALFHLAPDTTVTALLISGPGATGAKLADELTGLGLSFLLGTVDGGHAIVHDGPDSLADALHDGLASRGADVRVGVGEPMPLAESAISVRQAGLAMPRTGSGVRRIRAVPAHELLAGVLGDDAADILTAGSLRRLRTHDSTHGEQLAAAAVAYIEANGRLEAMARRLGVHRQTARGRVRRIEEVLGASLEDPDVRAELWLAIRAGG